MDLQIAKTLNTATKDFYEKESSSFSATRQNPWQGWEILLNEIRLHLPEDISVLDMGCGNMRFHSFIDERLLKDGCLKNRDNDTRDIEKHNFNLSYYGIDNCDDLCLEKTSDNAVNYQHLDIIDHLITGDLSKCMNAPQCDLSVAFGLMHHIALPELRSSIIQALANHTKPGGFITISFWQFMKNAKLAEKAVTTTQIGSEKMGIALNASENDYLLGWQDSDNVFRYCHNYTDEEINSLKQQAEKEYGLRTFYEFQADGKTKDLNKYVIFQRDID